MPEPGALLRSEPAFQALLALADPWLADRPDAVRTRLDELAPLDWRKVLAHARRHRVAPYAARRLEALGDSAAVPKDVLAGFRSDAQAAAYHELAMMALLRSVKGLFDDAGIGFLVIKGLVLSSGYHGRMGLRVNHDIDLVIDCADMDHAHELLASAGWVRVEPTGDLDGEALADWLRRVKDCVYMDPSGRIILELHHRLFDNPRLCEPGIMHRARSVTLFGQLDVRTLGEGDEPAYLALHGALHAWSRLKWLLDMGLVLKSLGPDGVAALLRQHIGRPSAQALYQAVGLCRQMFDATADLPSPSQSWPTRVLTTIACRAMVSAGTQELEDSRFGTTLKNVSHYLLWNRPGYWMSELAFDLTDTTRDELKARGNVPIWFSRPISWISRHWGKAPGVRAATTPSHREGSMSDLHTDTAGSYCSAETRK